MGQRLPLLTSRGREADFKVSPEEAFDFLTCAGRPTGSTTLGGCPGRPGTPGEAAFPGAGPPTDPSPAEAKILGSTDADFLGSCLEDGVKFAGPGVSGETVWGKAGVMAEFGEISVSGETTLDNAPWLGATGILFLTLPDGTAEATFGSGTPSVKSKASRESCWPIFPEKMVRLKTIPRAKKVAQPAIQTRIPGSLWRRALVRFANLGVKSRSVSRASWAFRKILLSTFCRVSLIQINRALSQS